VWRADITPNTCLVAVKLACIEIGVVQPLAVLSTKRKPRSCVVKVPVFVDDASMQSYMVPETGTHREDMLYSNA